MTGAFFCAILVPEPPVSAEGKGAFAVKRIFIGLIFVFFDFNLNFGGSTLELIPDFIGGYFLWKGTGELAEESEFFSRAVKPSFLWGICMGIQFVNNLLISSVDAVSIVLSIIGLALMLYVTYMISYGMVDIEMQAGSGAMRTSRLISAWKAMAVCNVMLMVSMLILPMLAIFLIIAGFVAVVCYLVFFHTAWKTYELTEPHE